MKKNNFIVLFILLFFSCEKEEGSLIVKEERIQPIFVNQMYPIDEGAPSYNVSNNVIQGITAFENGWFTTQTSSTNGGVLLVNYLDKEGHSLFQKRLYIESHGQDLSLDMISEDELYLYTTTGDFDDNRETGVLRLKVELTTDRNWSDAIITVDSSYHLNYSNCTPSLNTAKDKMAIRSKNTILVHTKEQLESNNFQALYHFDLNNNQLRDNGNKTMWFQGIAMQNDFIYCLTGNSSTTTHKKIFVYNEAGIVTKKYFFDKGDFTITMDEKFEPESLCLLNDELYFLIMTKSPDTEGNIKYLYKLKI